MKAALWGGDVDLAEEDFFDQLAIQPGAPAAHREYRLCQLEASSSYEARLSFPGGAPFLFRLTLRAADLSPDRPDRPTVPTGSAGHQLPRARRQLADIEKAVFATDAAGRVVASGLANSAVPLLAVTMEYNAVSDDPQLRYRTQAFHIVVDRLKFGLLPRGIPTLLALFAVLLPLMYGLLSLLGPSLVRSIPLEERDITQKHT
eukprot:g55351.t1